MNEQKARQIAETKYQRQTRAHAFEVVLAGRGGSLAAESDGTRPSIEYLEALRHQIFEWVGKVDARLQEEYANEERRERAEEAHDYASQSMNYEHPCRYGHHDCADVDRGRCSNEAASECGCGEC